MEQGGIALRTKHRSSIPRLDQPRGVKHDGRQGAELTRLRRQPEPLFEPRKDGKCAGSYLSDDDIAFIASGKFK